MSKNKPRAANIPISRIYNSYIPLTPVGNAASGTTHSSPKMSKALRRKLQAEKSLEKERLNKLPNNPYKSVVAKPSANFAVSTSPVNRAASYALTQSEFGLERSIEQINSIIGLKPSFSSPPDEAMEIHRKMCNESGVSFNKQTDIKSGFVYVVTNPAWPEHVKVGSALDCDDRLKSYQTGTPNRDYKLEFSEFFLNRKLAEKEVHSVLLSHRVIGTEWFAISVEAAMSSIKAVKIFS